MINKPTATDIAAAIELAEKGGWIDPSVVTVHWLCLLYDPEGKRVGDGAGPTRGEAMALAWLNVHAPDALMDAEVEPGTVPYTVPDGWRFEVTWHGVGPS